MRRRLVPNAARIGFGLAAGAAASLLLQAGAPAVAAWAALGGLLIGPLSALERLRGNGSSPRAASSLLAGLIAGTLAGAGAWLVGGQVAALADESAPALSALAFELSAFAALGLAAGAVPGFFSFSGSLSRDGALGGLAGGALAGALALLLPGHLALPAAGLLVAGGYVALRRSHASARLVPLGPEDVAGQFITLRQHWVTLGPGPECDLHVTDSAVKVIAPLVLTFREGTYWIEDPSGRQDQLTVNGEPVRSRRLQGGDIIEVGRHRYRFESIAAKSRKGGTPRQRPRGGA